MKTNLSRYQDDLGRLINLSEQMYNDLKLVASNKKVKKREKEPGLLFLSSYQQWYSEAHELIRQILPSRLSEFETLYHGNEKRKSIDAHTYAIKDWLLGIRSEVDYLDGRKYYDDAVIIFMRFQVQHEILNSAKLRFESSLMDIRQILRADLFDSEIESARELLKSGFLRAAGAVAGVVAEKHLEQICETHNVAIRKQNPTIGTYNDALKSEGIIEVPEWRGILRLGDLRNLCDHNRDREPTKDEVAELINGVEKLMKTVF
jgi:hypothetical protein